MGLEAEDGSVMAGLTLLERVEPPDGKPWSYTDIAFVCGCSHTRIRTLEKQALKKLRAAFIAAFKKRGLIMETTPESDLDREIWAVMSFDRVKATNLTYAVASDIIRKLAPVNDRSLCLVTAAAAARVKGAKTDNGHQDDEKTAALQPGTRA